MRFTSSVNSASFASFLLVLVTLAPAAFGQAPGAPATSSARGLDQEYTILGISVEGNRSGSAETIISQSGLRKSQKITVPSDAVRAAMQQLWSQNIFSNVEIVVDKEVTQTDGSIGV